jgi:hypothetical protein
MREVGVAQGVLVGGQIKLQKTDRPMEQEQSGKGKPGPYHQTTNSCTRKRVGNSGYTTTLGGREVFVHRVIIVIPLALPELYVCQGEIAVNGGYSHLSINVSKLLRLHELIAADYMQFYKLLVAASVKRDAYPR